MSQAQRLVLADKTRYDKKWEQILSCENELIEIQNLKSLAFQIQSGLAGCHYQYNRTRSLKTDSQEHSPRTDDGNSSMSLSAAPSSGSARGRSQQSLAPDFIENDLDQERLFSCGIPGTLDHRCPVNSLDQLYYQAVATHPILISKVQAWAALSRGYFQAGTTMPADTPRTPLDRAQAILFSSKIWAEGSSKFATNRPLKLDAMGCPPGRDVAGFVAWNTAREHELRQGGRVKWGPVKSVQRSLEKSTRSFGQVIVFCRGAVCARNPEGMYREDTIGTRGTTRLRNPRDGNQLEQN